MTEQHPSDEPSGRQIGLPIDHREPREPRDDVDLTIVTMHFDAADPATLVGILSKYVVLTRMEPGCRNVDLCASASATGRYLVVQKWESPGAQRAHFDGRTMLDMATSCRGVLAVAPSIELWDAASAHDLV